MDLHKKWHWRQRKLECRVRPETGNPQGDDLRDRLAALAGVNLQEILSEMKKEKTEKETINKGVFIDYEADKKQKEVLRRSHVVGASKFALKELYKAEELEASSKSRKNINKVYVIQPKSPSRRVLMDVLRERAKPLIIPNKDENREKTAKLEKKLAKQRAARMAAMTDKANADDLMAKPAVESEQGRLRLLESAKGVIPSYKGDLFSTGGDYLEGMLYLSRMLDDTAREKKGDRSDARDAERERQEEAEAKRRADEAAAEEEQRLLASGAMGTTQRSSKEDTKAKLFCAAAICNWARNPANASRLAEEGGVRALNKLSTEMDARTLMFVAAGFRLMAEQSTLSTVMVEEGCVAAITELIAAINNPFPGLVEHSEFIVYNLTIALVALSRSSGKEAPMVEDSIVASMMNLIQLNERLGHACVRGVYNLTCVDNPYSQFERVIRALISLSTQKSSSIKHICAAALCNFADLKSVRGRMIDEGVVSTLGNLARGSETRTRRVCAVILQNLSASKSVRLEMTSRHSVQIAYALSSDNDPIILRCIGLTMARLALEHGNAAKIITDSGIMALCNIAVKFPTIPGISQPASAAFQLLAQHPAHKQTIVQEGAIAAITTLLKMSSDATTMRQTLLALCLLNAEADNHMAILQNGVSSILQTLSTSDDDDILDLCSLAYLNMSLSKESHRTIISAGAMSSIISLARANKSLSTKRRCAVAMSYLCNYDLGLHRLVSDGIIDALEELLQVDDEETVSFAVAAVCKIAAVEEHAVLVTASGTVSRIVDKAQTGSIITKQFCASALSILTLYPSCSKKLCASGAVGALKTLSGLNDDPTKHRCLVAFGNLSCEESVQEMLVDQGLVQIISDLANSYHETSQACCASALCNLSCHEPSRLRVARDGGIQALMMISLVRSFDLDTKRLCVAALNNLLDENTMLPLVEEGIVGALANLCRMPSPENPDPKIVSYCAKLFSRISTLDAGKIKIAERQSTLVALLGMIDSPNEETQICIAHTTCNLVTYPAVAPTVMGAGAIRVLDHGLRSTDASMALHACKAAFVMVCMETKYRILGARSTIPKTLLAVATKSLDVKRTMVLKAMAVLAWYPESRVFMQNTEVVSSLLDLILQDDFGADADVEAWEAAGLLLSYLVCAYPFAMELCGKGLIAALRKMSTSLASASGSPEALSVAKAMATTCRVMLEDEACLPEFCVEDISDILLGIISADESAHTTSNTAISVLKLVGDRTSASMFATPVGNQVLALIAKDKKNVELLSVIICTLSADPATREVVGKRSTLEQLKFCLAEAPMDDTKYNVMSALYHQSKSEELRDVMVEMGFEELLLKELVTAKDDFKVNTTRALKNIQSEGGGAIEEGTVAALIAVSLEGKRREMVSDDLMINADLIFPHDEKPLGPPRYIIEADDYQQTPTWSATKELAPAQPSGRGPGIPEASDLSDRVRYADKQLHVSEEQLEENDVPEGRPNMAFAKMGLPSELKGVHLLDDDVFDNLKKSLEEPEEGAADHALLEDVKAEEAAVEEAAIEATSVDGGESVAESAGYSVEFSADDAQYEASDVQPKKAAASPSRRGRTDEEEEEEEEPIDMPSETAKLGLYN